MTLINNTLASADSDASNILTAFFAVIDTANNTMTYACAGHEPPIIRDTQNHIRELAVTAPMFGIFKNTEYSEVMCKLNKGDTIVLLTDGITEARHSGTVFFDRLGVIEHLKKVSDAEPEEIAETLLNAAASHVGGDLQDDAALVVLEV